MKTICLRNADSYCVSLSSSISAYLWSGFKLKFIKEAGTIASLSNPNIVNVIDVFEENGTAYYVMEYIDGTPLLQLIPYSGFDEKTTMRIINQLIESVGYIHSHNIFILTIVMKMLMKMFAKMCSDVGVNIRYEYKEINTENTISITWNTFTNGVFRSCIGR